MHSRPSGHLTVDASGSRPVSCAALSVQGKLPGWIRLPKSAALPFGSFEAAVEAAPGGDELQRHMSVADADPSGANLAAVRCVADMVKVHRPSAKAL